MHKRAGLAAIAAALFPIVVADAAGPFDGRWDGTVRGAPAQGNRRQADCPGGPIRLGIKDGTASGRADFSPSGGAVHGTVAADGSFTGSVGPGDNGIPFIGKFSGDSFTGSWTRGICEEIATLTRTK